jgi:hypothetical protein
MNVESAGVSYEEVSMYSCLCLESEPHTYERTFGLSVLISFEKQYVYLPSVFAVKANVPVGFLCIELRTFDDGSTS